MIARIISAVLRTTEFVGIALLVVVAVVVMAATSLADGVRAVGSMRRRGAA